MEDMLDVLPRQCVLRRCVVGGQEECSSRCDHDLSALSAVCLRSLLDDEDTRETQNKVGKATGCLGWLYRERIPHSSDDCIAHSRWIDQDKDESSSWHAGRLPSVASALSAAGLEPCPQAGV